MSTSPLHVLTVDFETFYSKSYTLSDMTIAEYVRSPYFETIGVSVAVDDGEPRWFSGTHDAIKLMLTAYPFDQSLVVAQNAMFDGAILEWIYDIHPLKYFCTMMAARPTIVPWSGKTSLKVIAQYLKIGEKGTEAETNIGMSLRDFDAARLLRYGEYCKEDVRLTYKAYKIFEAQLPEDEQDLIDLTIKKFTRPVLELNEHVLLAHLDNVRRKKEEILARSGLQESSILMSNEQLAALLMLMGVDPPTKVNKAGKTTWAFAKTDPEFKALLDHDDPAVQAVVAARLSHKSTLEESRTERFIKQAQLSAPFAVPILYYGAHTGRFSGLDKLNLQNLPRGGELRRAMVAPAGYAIVAGDLSQIEARITAALAGQWDLVNQFANGVDVYSAFASQLFGRTINKDEHPKERFIGKTCILGLGYGMGAPKLQLTLAHLKLPMSEAESYVNTYRAVFPHIKELWKTMGMALHHMAVGSPLKLGPVQFEAGRVVLPNGMAIHYPELSYNSAREWSYNDPFGKPKKIFGGALTENVVQALARIVISQAELSMYRLTGMQAVLQVHDELVYVVPERKVEAFKKLLERVLSQPVAWMPQLPVACEVKSGANYAECK